MSSEKSIPTGGPFSSKALDVLLQVMTLDAFSQYVSFPLYSTFFHGRRFNSWHGLCVIQFPEGVQPCLHHYLQIQSWLSNPTCRLVPTWWVLHPCQCDLFYICGRLLSQPWTIHVSGSRVNRLTLHKD